MNNIKKLRKFFRSFMIDGYLVPKNDEYFNEYVNPSKDRLKFISNFSGSAGFGIITVKKNYLFVDGRYTLQAHEESGKNFKIKNIQKEEVKEQSNEDFFFNQDIDYNEGIRSPGWARLQKRKLKRIK